MQHWRNIVEGMRFEMTERTPAWTVKGHHWSGWPGAYCMKCFCEDPIETAFAANEIFIGEAEDIQYSHPGVEERLNIASRCPIHGELVWNTTDNGWDLRQEDSSVTPYNRRPSDDEAK